MISVKEEVVTLSVYTTSDGAKFKNKEEAIYHEELVNKANILCDTNRVRFYDDDFNVMSMSYVRLDDVFYDDPYVDQYDVFQDVFEHAAYYYCADNEALEAIEYFGSTRFGFSCYDKVIIGYCSLLNDDTPIDMLQEFNDKRLQLMKMGYCFETNS